MTMLFLFAPLTIFYGDELYLRAGTIAKELATNVYLAALTYHNF